ncbi:MAG: hypothetical protein QOJ67_3857, partial [Acidimicrobiaceae bacterium]
DAAWAIRSISACGKIADLRTKAHMR